MASTAARPAEALATPPFHVPPELRGVDIAVLERFRQDAMAQEESRMRSQRLADIAAVVAFLEGRDGHAPEDPSPAPRAAEPPLPHGDDAPAGGGGAASTAAATAAAAAPSCRSAAHASHPARSARRGGDAPVLRTPAERRAAEAAVASDVASLVRPDDVTEAFRLGGLGGTELAARALQQVEGIAPTAASRPADAAPTAHVQAAAGASSRCVPSLAPVRFTPVADLLVSPRPPARSVSAVPRDALVGALAMLDAVSLAR